MTGPRPDIHELFCHYNSLYFSESLGTCIVSWAPNLTRMASFCDFIEEGLCEIQLSEPLLESRSSADIKNILLHEMIHAFLWLIHKNNNYSDHGSQFWNLANLINSNCKNDNQRPSNGYNITAQHGLHNGENIDIVYQWRCTSCGDLIKRGMNREPSSIDCIEKNSGYDCGNLLCGWHRHNMQCSGRYEKFDDASRFRKKGMSIGVQENEGDNHSNSSQLHKQARQRLPPAEEMKDKRTIKRPRNMEDYISIDDNKPKIPGKKSSEAGFCGDSNKLTVIDLRTQSLAAGPEIPKQRRTSCKKIGNLSNTKEQRKHKRRREINLVIKLLGVCTDEESEEDPEPLINRRSERRKRMKMANNSDGSGEKITALMPCEVISLD
ncbi:sprT-like domain-containing protein Spartan [Phalaenopsis equestris]|uniref:sprT-like domain-containing protein Spartan n=1 Tax=Phalaenopsis equestris TaxID=78828 RepID=UPI0009E5635D|nr:sprT-like domain-containing protein Spartan [Phalaenopsis equestris]